MKKVFKFLSIAAMTAFIFGCSNQLDLPEKTDNEVVLVSAGSEESKNDTPQQGARTEACSYWWTAGNGNGKGDILCAEANFTKEATVSNACDYMVFVYEVTEGCYNPFPSKASPPKNSKLIVEAILKNRQVRKVGEWAYIERTREWSLQITGFNRLSYFKDIAKIRIRGNGIPVKGKWIIKQ